jgi:HAD superfamily hydrolase (TIGR01509 family)
MGEAQRLSLADNPCMKPTPPSFDAVLFDLDGTLVDSETLGMDVLWEEGRALGMVLSREEAHRAFLGQPMGHCVGVVAKRVSRPASMSAEEFAADFTAHVRRLQAQRFRDHLQAMPGAHDLLSALSQPFCIATNGPREKAELTLGLTGLLPFFEQRLFTAYEVGHFKPAPGLFLHAAQALGAQPERCAVVEDSLPGVRAGVAAGMQVFSLMDVDDALMATGRVQRIAELAELHELLAA